MAAATDRVERRQERALRPFLVHRAAPDDGLAQAGLVHQAPLPGRRGPLAGIDLLHVVHEVQPEGLRGAGVEEREDPRFPVGADAIRALEAGVAEQLDHQLYAFLAADVLRGDGGLVDPLLDAADGFLVSPCDLLVHGREVIAGDGGEGKGGGARKGAPQDGTAGEVGHPVPSA